MLIIDGSEGEGGGQILRTSLSLAVATGLPFRIEKIRARRRKPGLQRQHLAAVRAAAEISTATVSGDRPGSLDLTFEPRRNSCGEFTFSVGSAGSSVLVLQTVLAPLLGAAGPSRIVLEGGTHNPMAPPFDFLARAFLPVLSRMGARVEVTLDRAGFYPRGGGRIRVLVEPARLTRIEIEERGPLVSRKGRAVVAGLPRHIADREAERLRRGLVFLDLEDRDILVEELPTEWGPGNYVLVELVFESGATEVVVAFGERGVRAEAVADEVVDRTRRFFEAGVPVGELLADQLLLPMSLAGGGSMRTLRPSLHTETNLRVLERFLGITPRVEQLAEDDWRIAIESRSAR